MDTTLKKNDVVRFMTNAPQVHLMEMFGHRKFNPDEILREEYVGRIKSVADGGEFFVISTLYPLKSFICVADAGDVIAKVALEDLNEEQKKEYDIRPEYFEAPNVYENDPSDLREGMSTAKKCEAVALKAVKALFPDAKVSRAGWDKDDSWMCHKWFLATVDKFIQEIKGKTGRDEFKSKRDRFAELSAKSRFKEYHSVDVMVKCQATEEDVRFAKEMKKRIAAACGEEDSSCNEEGLKTIMRTWLVAVDHNFEEVCIMRDIDERSSFFTSLGPEYNDIKENYFGIIHECIK